MADEFNPDEFISGIRTARTTVPIFKRSDLAGELIAVDGELDLLGEPAKEEDGATAAERTKLREKRDQLQKELSDSAVHFTLQAVGRDRLSELTKEARKSCKQEADQAAKNAAKWAREECVRSEVTDSEEVKEYVKQATSEASSSVVQEEIGAYILSEAIVNDMGGKIFSVDQMRTLGQKIGLTQIRKLQDTLWDLSRVDPAAFVPKSWAPGKTKSD